ncbi:flavodoxin family protein [Nocardioides marmotae]|uniref:flavodoxin family protein n=1 Tax=Nocardioides marmotae TaxID=2663857 RepID=UPI0012B67626|nr:hypothetical protein [Nocardioides marmotae]MBC9733415.1 hypothetical protein [Nocardioides marmotae]MTB84522.1 hypothetical protein [Nocardioides marmotae]
MARQLHAAVIAESMFGNTRSVADGVAAGIELEGATVDLMSVAEAPPLDSVHADLIVVGAPTHAFSLSRRPTREDAVKQGAPAEAAGGPGLREWIDAASDDGGGRLVAVFDTRVAKIKHLPANAAHRAHRMLERRGYVSVVRPAGFLVADVKGPLLPDQLEQATAWGRTVAVAAQNRMATSP